MQGLEVASYVFRTGKPLAGGFPLDPPGPGQGGEIMGRPKLSETALRRHVLTVRLNDAEHEELRRQAGKARLRAPVFIRQRLLERRLQVGSPAATRAGRVPGVEPDRGQSESDCPIPEPGPRQRAAARRAEAARGLDRGVAGAMIASVHKGGASFKGVVAYCLSEGRAPEDRREDLGDDKAGRVAWSDTRNLPTEDPRRAARVMAATVSRAEELKELAGVKAGGRALEKPVCHYSLSWGEDETPSPEEVRGAVTESLKVMGLEDRQAVMVAHRDKEHPHVHVVVNRVSVEDGRAAKLGNSYLKLSRWAERYEREQGRIRCPERVENNAGRERGKWVRCESMKPGPYRRGPGRKSPIRRRQVPSAQNPRDVAVVVVQRVDEWKKWNRAQAERRTAYRNLEPLQRRQWGELYRRQERERQTLRQDWGRLKGRVRQWRAQGKALGGPDTGDARQSPGPGRMGAGGRSTAPDRAGRAGARARAGEPGSGAGSRSGLPGGDAGADSGWGRGSGGDWAGGKAAGGGPGYFPRPKEPGSRY